MRKSSPSTSRRLATSLKEASYKAGRMVRGTLDPFSGDLYDGGLPTWLTELSAKSRDTGVEAVERLNKPAESPVERRSVLDCPYGVDSIDEAAKAESNVCYVRRNSVGAAVRPAPTSAGPLASPSAAPAAGKRQWARRLSAGLDLEKWITNTIDTGATNGRVTNKSLGSAGLDRETLKEILKSDRNRDGKLSYDDLIFQLKDLVHARKQYRRAARYLTLLVLFLLITISSIVVGTAITLKDTTVDNGTFVTYTWSGEPTPIATASLENAFGVVSNGQSFANLKPLLKEGPTRIALEFVDLSFIQFEPRFIQVFEASATVSNREVGVTLRLRAGAVPNVELSSAQDQFTQQTTPSLVSISSASASTSAAAVRQITLYSPRVKPLVSALGTDEATTPTTPTSASDNHKAAFVAANDALKKDVISELTLSLQTRLDLKAKRLLEPNNHHVLLGVNASDVPALCAHISSLGAVCGHNASLGDYYVGVAEQFGFLPLTATENARAAIKAWVRESGNPYGVTGFEPRFKAETAAVTVHAHGTPHPVHRALHQSAHRALLRTSAGQAHLRRKLEALTPQQAAHALEHANAHEIAEEEAATKQKGKAWAKDAWPEAASQPSHRRGLLPATFRNAVAKEKAEDVTCYSEDDAHRYRGTDVTTFVDGTGETQCEPWENFLSTIDTCLDAPQPLSPADQRSCLCSHFGLLPRADSDAPEPLVGNAPRAPCVGMRRPVCLSSRSTLLAADNSSLAQAVTWSLFEAAVPVCSSHYFADVFKRRFLPFSTKVPVFDDDWSWNLERVVKWSANYGSEGAYPDLAFCGEGVHVFVIDSGINANHRDFLDARGNSRIGTSYNAFDRVECAPGDMGACMDTGGHGTHVAGTVAGRRYGLASCATVHAVKISEGHAGASIDVLEAGIDWLIRYHNANIRWKSANGKKLRSVAVASLNAEAPVSHLNSMFVKLTWNGVAVSVAAGNNDVDACQSSPASAGGKSGSAVVTVAASAIDDSKAPYSNWGSCVDLFAPGTGIASAAAPDVTDGYTVMSGTSMAAPLVAGVMALVSEAYPNYSPLVIKYWLIWNSRQGLIDAVVPSSVVSEAYLRDILKRPGALTVKELNYLTRATQVECIGGRCVAEDAHNIDATPNLLLRIPRNDLAKTSWWSRQRRLSQATANTDTETDSNISAVQEEPLLVCHWTVGVLDGAECPPKGAAVCGELRGHDPLGASVLRPFVRKHAVCADGCWCDPDAPEASYEEYVSCVGNPKYPNDYEYSGEACSPVYVLDRTSEVEALQDKTLVYAPLPGGVAFNAPRVLAGEGVVDAFATAESEGEIQMDGETLYMTRPVKLPIGTDSSLKRSLYSHETFSYFGKEYETIYVSENGYICFTESNVQAATPSIAEHFSAARGPCFSVFLSDLAFDSRGAAGIYLTHIFAGAVAPYTPRATVVTYYLAHGDGDSSGNTFSVQARLEYFSNSVWVSFDKQLPTTLSAVVGPSAGAAPQGFAASSAHSLVFS